MYQFQRPVQAGLRDVLLMELDCMRRTRSSERLACRTFVLMSLLIDVNSLLAGYVLGQGVFSDCTLAGMTATTCMDPCVV
jgi:hypothetical protein